MKCSSGSATLIRSADEQYFIAYCPDCGEATVSLSDGGAALAALNLRHQRMERAQAIEVETGTLVDLREAGAPSEDTRWRAWDRLETLLGQRI